MCARVMLLPINRSNIYIYIQRVRFIYNFIACHGCEFQAVDMISFRASWTYILIGSNPVSGKIRPTYFLSYALGNFIRIDRIARRDYYRSPRPSLSDKK